MKYFKYTVRKFSKQNYKNFIDITYVVPASSMKSLRFYEGVDEEDRYYCDFLLSFDGVDGEVLTILNSKDELEAILKNCYEDTNVVLNLGIVQIERDYDSTFSDEFFE